MTRKLTPPHKLETFAVIIRAMGGNGEADQRAALNELYRRRAWLSLSQGEAAIAAAGRLAPTTAEEHGQALAEMGYAPAPVPLDARPVLPVIFRAEASCKERVRPGQGSWSVTAVFPTLPGDNDPWTATCYAYVGQHSACSPEWYYQTRATKPEEYADLLAELRSIYERDDDPDAVRLVIAKRWTQHHNAARRAAIRATGRTA